MVLHRIEQRLVTAKRSPARQPCRRPIPERDSVFSRNSRVLSGDKLRGFGGGAPKTGLAPRPAQFHRDPSAAPLARYGAKMAPSFAATNNLSPHIGLS
jgi:hypothetical protein